MIDLNDFSKTLTKDSDPINDNCEKKNDSRGGIEAFKKADADGQLKYLAEGETKLRKALRRTDLRIEHYEEIMETLKSNEELKRLVIEKGGIKFT